MNRPPAIEILLPDLTSAFNAADKDGFAEIKLQIPVPRTTNNVRTLETLRVRATPIELIGSYLVGGDIDKAETAFHNALLENLYEQLQIAFKARVCFTSSFMLTTLEDPQFGKRVVYEKPARGKTTYELRPECKQHGQLQISDGTDERICAQITTLTLDTLPLTFEQHIQTTVLQMLQQLASQLRANIAPMIHRFRELYPLGEVHVGLVPDVTTTTIHYRWDEPNQISSSAAIVLYLYGTEDKHYDIS